MFCPIINIVVLSPRVPLRYVIIERSAVCKANTWLCRVYIIYLKYTASELAYSVADICTRVLCCVPASLATSCTTVVQHLYDIFVSMASFDLRLVLNFEWANTVCLWQLLCVGFCVVGVYDELARAFCQHTRLKFYT